ncbi:hypothetical protein B7494_g3340 [Chlorociboria aeruginascens]|nr:hypothetical protein B7494_g3340 [Chlorociboria aeruginascens]
MVSSRKRGRQEMEAPEPVKEPTLIEGLRNMWEFANLAQWIFTFGTAVKLDENLDIEELEMECLKSDSTVLPEIGLALLKFVSSHRGLTPEIFDEYTRRQYVAKSPLRNPFGIEEEPAKFNEFDVFTKIRVLQQLTQWAMSNPDRIRERMEEQKDTEQTIWRVEAYGWDSDDRTYIVLDDDRLYRRTDPPLPPPPAPKPKKNSKKAKAALRASKRRKVSDAADGEADHPEPPTIDNTIREDDGFGGMTWECIAVTVDELNAFIKSLEKTRDGNEKALRKRLIEELLPLLEKHEETRKRKAAQKERELLNLEKLATAKRSSRIAGKMEQQKQEEEAREAERKKQAELIMAKKEQEKWLKLEKERESRMMTREQRVKEREARRILHQEELANLSEDSKKLETGGGRLSERHLKAEIERKKQALEELAEEDDWIFDCICGAYGQIDDGTHSIACDKCNIWQHSKCVGVSQTEAEREDFHFICTTCKRRAEDTERAKNQPPIKIKLNRPGSSSSSMVSKQATPAVIIPPMKSTPQVVWPPKYLNGENTNSTTPINGRPITPREFERPPLFQNVHKPILPPAKHIALPDQRNIQTASQDTKADNLPSEPHYTPRANGGNPSIPPPNLPRPSSANPFSSPHPYSPTILPPPPQPHAYSFMNGGSSNGHPVGPSTQHSPMRSSPIQTSPPFTNNHSHPFSPTQRPDSRDGPDHQTFNNLSPLTGPPNLAPIDKSNQTPILSRSSSPLTSFSTTKQPSAFPSGKSSSPVSQSVAAKQDQTLSHTIGPGISPIKHSPPRPTTSNGSFGSATPSILPPVASLNPSPRVLNPTPPVKVSEPDRSHQSSQRVAP